MREYLIKATSTINGSHMVVDIQATMALEAVTYFSTEFPDMRVIGIVMLK